MSRLFSKKLRNTREFGNKFEKHAETYLQKAGLKLKYRNYLCKSGEIDLIMLDIDQNEEIVLVFVEVRYRKNDFYGTPLETVNHSKRRRIRLAASHFLLRQSKYQHLACRFDVVGISSTGRHDRLEIQWVKSAFV